jgi:hypothetical protein
MKLLTGSLAAGLVLLAGAAQAQVPGRYTAASDFDAPYAAAPPVVPGPRYEPGPRYGYGPGPGLLPSTEVYAVLRDNGFLPLGIPRLRGFVYTIAVIDRGGGDGRLVIDARNGRIIRFLPAYRMGDNDYEDQSVLRAPSVAQPPPAQTMQPPARDQVQAAPRPSRPAHVASRSVPMPKASPIAAAKPAPAPVQQAEAPASKSADKAADAQATAPVTTGSAPAKPVPSIAPTQDMPKVQGLE